MSEKREIGAEEKVRTVEAVLRGEMGIREAGRQIGTSNATVRRWISRYQAEGPSAFIHNGERSYSPELKEAAVKEYVSGRGSLSDICKKYKIRSDRQLRNWIKVYNSGRDFKKRSGGSRMSKARKTSQEERIQIARECLESGKDYGCIAQKYQVSYQQVYSWVKKYEEMGEAGLEDRRGQRTRQQEPRTPEEELKAKIAQLEHENYMLKMERDLLKKVKELERRDRWGK